MRKLLSYRYSLIVFGILAAILTGCASSTPARFYTLSSMNGPEPARQAADTAHAVLVSVGPLTIPDYLDRFQIVTRSGQNELTVDEYHRWAGSLENDISRVIIENLSALLPPDRYQVVSWIHPVQPPAAINYRVAVDITRFDGAHGDSVSMKARWSIFRKDSDSTIRQTDIIEHIKGNDYNELVEAMSRTMESLSRDIAAAITSL